MKTAISREDYIRLRNKNKTMSNTEFAALLKKADHVGKNGEQFTMHMVEARNIRYKLMGLGDQTNKPKTLDELKILATEKQLDFQGNVINVPDEHGGDIWDEDQWIQDDLFVILKSLRMWPSDTTMYDKKGGFWKFSGWTNHTVAISPEGWKSVSDNPFIQRLIKQARGSDKAFVKWLQNGSPPWRKGASQKQEEEKDARQQPAMPRGPGKGARAREIRDT